MKGKKDCPVAASSATYRNAVNKISDALNQSPSHSRYPSLDLNDAIDDLPDALKQKAIEWYIRGIKRGIAKATELVASREIYQENRFAIAPMSIDVKVRTKFRGGDWEPLNVSIDMAEIGFVPND